MKVVNPIGRVAEAVSGANYAEPKGGCVCYQTDTNADAKQHSFLCTSCQRNCFQGNTENNLANLELAEAKGIFD